MAATATTPTSNPRETSIIRFKFVKKVYPGVKIADSKDIRMSWDRLEKNALRGFEITIQKSNEKK